MCKEHTEQEIEGLVRSKLKEQKDENIVKCKSIVAAFMMSREFDTLCNDMIFKPERFKKNHQKILDLLFNRLQEEL